VKVLGRGRIGLRFCAAFAMASCVTSFAAVGLLERSMGAAVSSVVGFVDDVDIIVTGTGRTSFAEELYFSVAEDAQVAAAAPLLRQVVSVDGQELTLMGVDARVGHFDAGAAARVDEALAGNRLDRGWASADLGFRPGDVLDVVTPRGEAHLVLGDILNPADTSVALGSTVVVALPHAQELTGVGPRLDAVLVDASPGADTAVVAQRLQQQLGPAVNVDSMDAVGHRLRSVAEPVREALLLIVVLSGLVAVAVLFQVSWLAAAEETPNVGILRAIGATRSSAAWWFAKPVLVTSALGIAAGLFAAPMVARWQVEQLPGTYVDTLAVVVPYAGGLRPLFVAAAAGLCAAGLASAVAIGTVWSVPPLGAIVPASRARQTGWRRSVAGIAMAAVLASGAAYSADVGAGVIAVVLAGLAAVAAAIAFAAPLVALLAMIVERGGTIPELVAGGLRSAPARVVASVTAVAIVVGSYVAIDGIARDTVSIVQGEYERFAGPRVLVAAGSGVGYNSASRLPESVVRTFGDLEGVRAVSRRAATLVDVRGADVVLTGVDSGMEEVLTRDELRRFRAGDGVVVSRALAAQQSVDVGERLTFATASGTRTRTVLAVVSSVGWQGGTITARYGDVTGWMGFVGPTAVELKTAETHVESVAADARAVLREAGVAGSVLTGEEVLDTVRATADQAYSVFRTLRATVAIAAMTALPAAVAITATERRGVLSTLRALGLTRLRTATVTAGEVLVAVALGVAFGTLVGLAMHAVVLRGLAGGDFGTSFSIDVRAIAATLGWVVAAASVVSVLPAGMSARRRIVTAAEVP
jgi:putative ABC transport system permease protein